MLKQETSRYELLVRIRNFGSKHQSLFPATSVAGKAFAIVAEATAAIEHQSATRLVSAHAGTKDRVVARKDVRRRLMALARTARRAGRLEPSVGGAFKLPRRKSDEALLTAARAFVREGEAASPWWVPLGLPETSIADLARAVEAYAQAINGRREGRDGLTAARAALKAALARGFDAVCELDVIVANTPELDPVVLAVWRESRRVNPKTRAGSSDVVTPPAAPVAETTMGDALQKAS